MVACGRAHSLSSGSSEDQAARFAATRPVSCFVAWDARPGATRSSTQVHSLKKRDAATRPPVARERLGLDEEREPGTAAASVGAERLAAVAGQAAVVATRDDV